MKKRVFVFIVLIVALIFYFGYSYIYQDHRNISKESADYIEEASHFHNSFSDDPKAASDKYLNKTLIVKGKITELTEAELTLNNAIFCSFLDKDELQSLRLNSEISVKGRCIGYDDLLEEIKLDQCSITNEN